jgi:hypothetical protein
VDVVKVHAVGLQALQADVELLERVLGGLFGREELGGEIHVLALALQEFAHHRLRTTATVAGGRVEVVDARIVGGLHGAA